jgi:hypothetical protein
MQGIVSAERELRPMAGFAQNVAFVIPGLLFEVAGIAYTIRGKVSIGMMFVAVGILFITVGVRQARRRQNDGNVESRPPKNEREH